MSIIITSNFDLRTGLPLREFEQVADVTARDAIPTEVRYDGFPTYTVATQENWQLQGGITNGDWVLVGSGAGITGIGSPESVAIWSSGTNLTANTNFTRSNTTQIVNNEQGLDLGVNTTTTRYVDPAGSDLNNGLTLGTPWATFQHAYNEMAAFLPGTYEIIPAAGTYSENLLPPYNSLGRAADSGGTVVSNVGDETTPANIIISGSGDVYSNDIFGRGYNGAMKFAGFRFVGDLTGDFIISNGPSLVGIRNCEFAQTNNCVTGSFGAKIIFEPQDAGAGIVIDNVSSLVQVEDFALAYIACDVTATNLRGDLITSSGNSAVKFDENLTLVATGTNATSFFKMKDGSIQTGNQNQFTHNDGSSTFKAQGMSSFSGGIDNIYESINCARVAELSGSSIFLTSEDGSASYSISGTTPSSENFFLFGQSLVYNQLNTGTGSPEIPMAWFTSEALADTRYVLATDWRYKTSTNITLPGRLLPGTSGWLTAQGISDICIPIYRADKPEIFPRFTITYRTGNGATATDTYTIYINGSATSMVGTITNGTEVTVTANPQVLEVGDQVSIFVNAHATTTAEDISVSY